MRHKLLKRQLFWMTGSRFHAERKFSAAKGHVPHGRRQSKRTFGSFGNGKGGCDGFLPKLLAIAAALASAGCWPTQVPVRPNIAPVAGGWRGPAQVHDNVAQRLLAAHNRERSEAGVPPLVWDEGLAAAAAVYAPIVARSGGLEHAPASMRQGQGENLWTGTRGAFPLEQMVRDWASEKHYFRAGVFPDVSSSGNWGDVGHYTQIIWRQTTRVGCAVHQVPAADFLSAATRPPAT
jgi:hypothetical protein